MHFTYYVYTKSYKLQCGKIDTSKIDILFGTLRGSGSGSGSCLKCYNASTVHWNPFIQIYDDYMSHERFVEGEPFKVKIMGGSVSGGDSGGNSGGGGRRFSVPLFHDGLEYQPEVLKSRALDWMVGMNFDVDYMNGFNERN